MAMINIFKCLATSFLIFSTCLLIPIAAVISDLRACSEPTCSVAVSLAKTVIDYQSNDHEILAFKKNIDVKVFSKAAGNRTDVWGVEINGKRGYAPHRFLREHKVIEKNTTCIRPTEITEQLYNSKECLPSDAKPIAQEQVVPELSKISPSYEVWDGTTIPTNLEENAPETLSYSTQVHKPQESETEPVLSLHPIVESTLSFISNAFSASSTDSLDPVKSQEEEENENKNESNEELVEKEIEEKESLETPSEMSDVKSTEQVPNTEQVEQVPEVVEENVEEKKENLEDLENKIPENVEKENEVVENVGEEDEEDEEEDEIAEKEVESVEKKDETVEVGNVEKNEENPGKIEQVENLVPEKLPEIEVKEEEIPKSLENLNSTVIEHLELVKPEEPKMNESDKVDQIAVSEEIEKNETLLDVEIESIEQPTTEKPSNEIPNNFNVELVLKEPEISNSSEPEISEEIVTQKQEEIFVQETTTEAILPDEEENLVFVEQKNATEENITENESLNIGFDQVTTEKSSLDEAFQKTNNEFVDKVLPNKFCDKDSPCPETETEAEKNENLEEMERGNGEENNRNFWERTMFIGITAFTTLILSLGYYYIEKSRRDSHLIEKINKLEKELMISTKECVILDDNLKTTSQQLNSIQDQSFGSNEMVSSLKNEIEELKVEIHEKQQQIETLERDLEIASEAGLELEKMLREVLSSNSEDNPLAKSIEDLQERLNNQQSVNESVTSALNIKIKENEKLSANLKEATNKLEQLQAEVEQLSQTANAAKSAKLSSEQQMSDELGQLKSKLQNVLEERTSLRNQVKHKEHQVEELSRVVEQFNDDNLNLEKLYEVAHVKAESAQLLEERNELKVKIGQVEGAHHLLEEHVKIVQEQITSLSEQCKQAEKEKKDAETKLEVLTNFFKEKEAQRQKEEAIWLEKQGEVSSTVERLQILQDEIQNYKQQVELLKREIFDQEKEFKSQITTWKNKADENWVTARQTERRLEESKMESAQLRNRLTMVEKSIDNDTETKLHRLLETNGETATSPPMFLGAELSNSPVMFAGAPPGAPPPPPFMYPHMPPPPPPPFLPPPLPPLQGGPGGGSGNVGGPFEVGQRPPTLGGRMASPPPPPLHHMAPFDHRHPPLPPPHNFIEDHRHSSPPPPPLGYPHWADEPPMSHNRFPRREQRSRNHKGSLESLDKQHHGGKI